MSKSHRHGIPVFSTQATATVSVSLVLVILGIMGLLGVAVHSVGNDIRQQVGMVVVLDDGLTDAQVTGLKRQLSAEPYAAAVRYSSPDDVMARWLEIGGGDAGDMELLGVNPFSSEIEISMTPDYSVPEKMERIAAGLRRQPGVAEVTLHSDMVRSINATMRSLALVLSIVAGALLIISFVLINNTVRLMVYARRFTIHTMKLVGATAGFIRRPFVVAGLVNGMIAGVIALAVLSGVLFYVASVDPVAMNVVGWQQAAVVFAALFVVGVLICMLASLFAANKYLRLGYDEMFR